MIRVDAMYACWEMAFEVRGGVRVVGLLEEVRLEVELAVHVDVRTWGRGDECR